MGENPDAAAFPDTWRSFRNSAESECPQERVAGLLTGLGPRWHAEARREESPSWECGESGALAINGGITES